MLVDTLVRIVYIVDRFPSLSETFVLRELQELRRRGDEVSIFSRRRPDPGHPVHDGTDRLLPETTYLPRGAVGALRLAVDAGVALVTSPRGAGPALFWSLRARLRERGALRAFVEAAYVCRRLRRESTTSTHVSRMLSVPRAPRWPPRCGAVLVHRARIRPLTYRPSLVRRKARAARFIVAVSDYSARYLLALVDPRDQHKVVVVCNGVDTGAFGPRAEHQSPPLVLTVARLIEKKGVDLVPAAARLLLDEGFALEWQVVGDGPLREALEGDIAAARSARSSRSPARYPTPSLRTTRPRRRCSSFPVGGSRVGRRTRSRLFSSRPWLPAPRSSRHRWAGMTELVEQDVNGLVVPKNDPRALATAVARVLVDAPLRERLTAAGLRTAAELELARSVRVSRELFERRPVTA